MGKSRKEELLLLLKEDPKDSFTKYALAMEYIAEGDTDNAYTLYQEIVRDDKNYLAVYYQFGKLCERLNKKEEASRFYQDGMAIAKEQKRQHTFNELRSAYDILNEDDE